MRKIIPITISVVVAALLTVLSSGCRGNRELETTPPRLERLAYESAIRQLAADLSNNYPLTDEKIWKLLSDFVSENDKIFGCGYATPPLLTFPKCCATYYVHRGKFDKPLLKYNPGYEFSRRPDSAWYYLALKSDNGTWTEPYETTDSAGKKYRMVSYSLPVFAPDKPGVMQFIAVVDIALNN